MPLVITLALFATLAGNILLLARYWPSLVRALSGPRPLAAPSRPPAEVIRLADRRPVPARPGPLAVRMAA